MNKKISLTIVAIIVMALSLFSFSADDEKKPLGKMNMIAKVRNGNIGNRYDFTLAPGKKATIKVTIDCMDEHELKLFQNDEQKVSIRKTKGGCIKRETFEIFNNPNLFGAVAPMSLTIKDWLPPHRVHASGVVVEQNENYAKIAFEDGPDNNYKDTIVEIQVSDI